MKRFNISCAAQLLLALATGCDNGNLVAREGDKDPLTGDDDQDSDEVCLNQGGCDQGDGDGDGDVEDLGAACPDLAADVAGTKGGLILLSQREDVRASQAQWEATSPSDRDYTYQASYASWTGWHCSGTVEVVDGVIVSRSHSASGDGGSTEEWTETGADIGSHAGGCAEAKLLEELYAECLDDVLCHDPAHNELSVVVDEGDQLLRTCTFRPYDCEDDCTEGVHIELVP